MDGGDRTCTGCQRMLPAEAFGWKDRAAGRRQSRCNACMKAYQATWYRANAEAHRVTSAQGRRRRRAANRLLVVQAKSVPCADCGQRYSSEQMDFDHVRGIKRGNIADVVANLTPESMRFEIAKCEVVCAVCHRVRTIRRSRQR